MRRILIEAARQKGNLKRGGQFQRIEHDHPITNRRRLTNDCATGRKWPSTSLKLRPQTAVGCIGLRELRGMHRRSNRDILDEIRGKLQPSRRIFSGVATISVGADPLSSVVVTCHNLIGSCATEVCPAGGYNDRPNAQCHSRATVTRIDRIPFSVIWLPMRFVVGSIPENDWFDPQLGGWTSVKDHEESGHLRNVALLLTFGVVVLAIAAVRQANASSVWLLIAALVSPVLLLPLHELLHAIAYRVPLSSDLLIAGLCPDRRLCYVIYDGPLARNRVVQMLLAPFICFSVFPMLALPWLSNSNGWLLITVSLLHASMSLGDLLFCYSVVTQAPKGAIMRNHGWTTYWSHDVTADNK